MCVLVPTRLVIMCVCVCVCVFVLALAARWLGVKLCVIGVILCVWHGHRGKPPWPYLTSGWSY